MTKPTMQVTIVPVSMLLGIRLKAEMPIIIPDAKPSVSETSLLDGSLRAMAIRAPTPVTSPAIRLEIRMFTFISFTPRWICTVVIVLYAIGNGKPDAANLRIVIN